MKLRRIFQFLALLSSLAVLTACGSSGGSSGNDSESAATVPARGTVVDPYIEGAVLQEVTHNGTVLQRQSTPSDAAGNFTFPRALTPGSFIEMKVGSRGFHNGVPYQGILRRQVDTAGDTVVVSPLTTLLANGASFEEVLSFLAAAGLSGMTAADLVADPMAGLKDLSLDEVVDDQLRNLRAAMAVNAFLHILNDYRAGAADLVPPMNRQLMADLVQGTQEALSVSRLVEIASTLANDPGLTDTPMLLGDGIRMAAACMQTVGDLAGGGTFPSGTAIRKAVADAMAVSEQTARDYLLARIDPPAVQEPPTPPSAPALGGGDLYAVSCAGCHGALASSTKSGRTASQIQNAINANFGGMGFLTLTAAEVQAIADALLANAPAPAPTPTPVPAPTPVLDGADLYAAKCAGCHGPLAQSTKAGRTAAQIRGAIDANFGGMAFLSPLREDEVRAIAESLPAGGTISPAPLDCTACHGQPPAGSTFPNTAGAHGAHRALPGVGTNCAVCHTGAAHNGWVDLGFPSVFNAKSGAVVDNGDGTCSNVSCHGGQRTPDWWTGTIDVNTQCTTCHASGTSQYNGYASGRHSKHVGSERLACTACHDTGKLATNHFAGLDTAVIEEPASATIGGGTTRVTSYNPATRSCTNSCHGSKTW